MFNANFLSHIHRTLLKELIRERARGVPAEKTLENILNLVNAWISTLLSSKGNVGTSTQI
jgi:hypothetical protein